MKKLCIGVNPSGIRSWICVIIACLYIFCKYFLSKSVGYFLLILLFTGFSLQRKYTFKLQKTHLPIIISSLLFGVYMMLGTTWTILPHTTFATSVLTLVTLIIGLAALNKRCFFETLPKGLLIFSLIESVGVLLPLISPSLYFAVLSHIPGDTYEGAIKFLAMGRSSGFTPQTAYVGYFTSIGIAVLFNEIMFRSHTGRTRMLYIFLLTFEIIALILTFKRSGMVAVAISSFVILILNKKISIINVVKYGSLILVIGFAVGLYVQNIPEFKDSIERLEIRDDGSDMTSGRGYLADKALDIFEENPIIGVGYGGYSAFSERGTHNVYLEVLCEGGIVGFLLYIPYIIINLWKVVNNIIKQKGDPMLLNMSLFIQLYYIIYSFVGNCLTDNFIFLLYVLMSALPYVFDNNKKESAESPSKNLFSCR